MQPLRSSIQLRRLLPGAPPAPQAPRGLRGVPAAGVFRGLGGMALALLLARTLLTALLAPVLCSLQLLLWRQQGGGVGRR